METEEETPELFVDTLLLLVREECSGNNVISYSFTPEGFQMVEITDETGEEPWLTASLTYPTEEQRFETVARLAVSILVDIIEREIGKMVDEKAALN